MFYLKAIRRKPSGIEFIFRIERWVVRNHSAAQLVRNQKEFVAIVASQDREVAFISGHSSEHGSSGSAC